MSVKNPGIWLPVFPDPDPDPDTATADAAQVVPHGIDNDA